MPDVIQGRQIDAQRITDRMKPSNDTSTATLSFIVAMVLLGLSIPYIAAGNRNSMALPIMAGRISGGRR